VQKPVNVQLRPRRRLRPLSPSEKSHLEGLTAEIESEPLKAALDRLGRGIYGSRKTR
jgi:hypothetical protein